MTYSPVTTDIHQTFDIHLDFRTQSTFDFKIIVDDSTDFILLLIIPVLDFLIPVHTCYIKDLLSSASSDTKDVGQSNFTPFMFR